jgi:hypothetical protein
MIEMMMNATRKEIESYSSVWQGRKGLHEEVTCQEI